MPLRDTLLPLVRPGLPRRRANMWATVYDSSVGAPVRIEGGEHQPSDRGSNGKNDPSSD